MTNKLTLTEQEELFAKDCKLINLKYEYNGYTGDERWAIITELSVKELWEKYPCKRQVLSSKKWKLFSSVFWQIKSSTFAYSTPWLIRGAFFN